MKLGMIVSLLCVGLTFAAPIDRIGALSVSGGNVVGSKTNGAPAQLMGMSFYHGQYKAGRDFVNRGTITTLAKDWHASVIRIPMMYYDEGSGALDGKGYQSNVNASTAMVDSVIKIAIDLGIYVVVDWHEVHAIENATLAATFFTDIATRWGSYPNVIYEIFNEPMNSPWASSIKPYATTVVNAIRAKDPDNLIVVGTNTWSQDVMEPANSPLAGTNIAYTLHFYASDIDHVKLMARADSAMAAGIALFATEWGISNASGGGTLDQGRMSAWNTWLLKTKVSSCNWSLTDLNETSAALTGSSWGSDGSLVHTIPTTGGWTDAQLSVSGKYIKNMLVSNSPAWTAVALVSSSSSAASNLATVAPQVYLLPVAGGLQLILPESQKVTQVELLDLLGHVIVKEMVANAQTTVELRPTGSYHGMVLVRITGNGQSRVIPATILR